MCGRSQISEFMCCLVSQVSYLSLAIHPPTTSFSKISKLDSCAFEEVMNAVASFGKSLRCLFIADAWQVSQDRTGQGHPCDPISHPFHQSNSTHTRKIPRKVWSKVCSCDLCVHYMCGTYCGDLHQKMPNCTLTRTYAQSKAHFHDQSGIRSCTKQAIHHTAIRHMLLCLRVN